jgi:Arc/MetJ family transcription regulator
MRTTLEIDPKLLEEAAELVGEKNKGRVVNQALRELVRRRRLAALRASLGTWDLDLDDWYEFRHQERG